MTSAALHGPRVAALATLLLLALALPIAALAQTDTTAPAPSADARARLAQAASDPSLPAWQRDVMRDVARGDQPAGAPTAAAPAPDGARATEAFDGTWSEMVIDSRYSHPAVYDPVRDCMVVFGGCDSTNRYLNDTWVLTLSGTPAWYRLETPGAMPTPRLDASMIYDRRRDRIVIFGGRAASNPQLLNDVWALSLATAASWVRLTPDGLPPTARYGHSAIYDPNGDRMMVFGGYDSTYVLRNDVWALWLTGTPAWTALAPTGTPPTARWQHVAIYDPPRARMLIQGGSTNTGGVTDVYALSLTGLMAWTALSPTGSAPSGRVSHCAVYDPVRDRMLVYGGSGSGDWYAYVWALTLAGTPQWSVMGVTAPMPSARFEASMIYDAVGDRLVVFGGQNQSGGARNDVWSFPLGVTPAWTEITPTGGTPDGRNFASAIVDTTRHRMIVFAGAGPGGGRRNDLCAISLAGAPVWSAPAATGTPPSWRYGHSAIYDPVRDRMVVFGGNASGSVPFDNELWALSLAGTPAWTQLTPAGTPPYPRTYHSAIYDPVRDRMLVFGGFADDGTFWAMRNDVWSLSLAAPAWSQLTPAGTPPPTREMHSAIYDPVRDRMVIFAGDHNTRYNDLYALSLSGAPTWSAITPTGTLPTARSGHIAIYDPVRDRMVVCGGVPGGTSVDTWALSLAGTPAWTQLAPASVLPDARGTHVGVYDAARDRMVIFGGANARSDVWALTWTSPVGVGEPPVTTLDFLRPPAPNPMRGAATVTFALRRAGHVSLGVYDVAGRLVRTLVDGERGAGETRVRWDGADAAGARLRAGVYLVRLVTPDARMARKVVVLE